MVSNRDYYDLLDLEKTATYDDIKTAYKRQALLWHPDKNQARLDEATERFKAISEAYSVLSDPRERAWYDTHKDQILSGQSEDLGINLWPFFSPSAYPGGFTAAPDGFYAVFGGVFETLAKEENAEAADKTEIRQMPNFGDADSPIEAVLEFYSYWTNFTTGKKFFWADKYDLREGEQRRIRRLMEAENKKERGREKKAYVDLVRELAEHVKRRDPRWTEYQDRVRIEKEAKQATEIQQKQEESKRMKELKEKFRKEEAERYAREYDEMRRKQEEEGIEPAEEGDDEEEEDPFICEACKKTFSTEKQLRNHEQSKKHKQKMIQIRAEVELPEERPVQTLKPQKPAKPAKPETLQHVKIPPQSQRPESSSSGEEDLSTEHFVIRRKETSDNDEEDHIPEPSKPPVEEEKKESSAKKLGKAKLKRQKKTERAAGPGLSCKVCGLKFDTRNKLFGHIKDSGHATAVET